jgi:hypothetical protein
MRSRVRGASWPLWGAAHGAGAAQTRQIVHPTREIIAPIV